MTARGIGVEKAVVDPGEGWFGMARPVESTAPGGPPDEPVETDRRSIRDSAPTSWEFLPTNREAWDFTTSSGGARHRGKVLLLIVAMIGVSSVAVGIVLFAGASGVSESPAPSAPPSPTGSSPVVASQSPAPSQTPSAPPPPPPPAAEQMNPPVTRAYHPPRHRAPDEPRKPRTDVTRAPMSASPPVVSRIPERNSSTPGDARRHGLFG